MADYSAQLVNASTGTCHRTETAISMSKAAVLHDVFQRVGALDIHFGLQKDLCGNEYPFPRQQEHVNPNKAQKNDPHNSHETRVEPPQSSEHSDASLTKKFTVDELYMHRLQKGPSNVEGTCTTTSQPAVSACGSNKNAMGSSLHVDAAVGEGPADETENANTEKQNDSGVVHFANDGEGENGGAVGAHKTGMRKPGSNVATQGTANRDFEVDDFYGTPATSITKDLDSHNLLAGESLDVDTMKRATEAWRPSGEPSGLNCSIFSQCTGINTSFIPPHVLPEHIENKMKRLYINIWFQRWLVPNVSTAVKCLSNMAVEFGDGIRQYFRPLKLDAPRRKFEEVHLSSLEYAIVKDDVTRCYFSIDNEHKEHLMMREVDDYRRMFMKKRINFEEFCQHFHPYLSNHKEDYTRNKMAGTDEEALHNRAIQQILEKSMYGLSIEQPNEFFKKNCTLKPYQALEPIPHK